MKSGIVMVKAAFSEKEALFIYKLDLILKKKLVTCYIASIVLCGAVRGTLQREDLKCLASFKMWCRERMEFILWTNRVNS
jgi:hypothetical protein